MEQAHGVKVLVQAEACDPAMEAAVEAVELEQVQAVTASARTAVKECLIN